MSISCEKIDETIVKNNTLNSDLQISIFTNSGHFAQSNPNIYNQLKSPDQSNLYLRQEQYSEEYDFYYDLDKIQVIEKTEYAQYTVVVEREDDNTVLLNYVFMDYYNGEQLQYLVTYPKIDTVDGVILDHTNASIEFLNGSSIIERQSGQPNCLEGIPELVAVTQEYICTEVKCGGDNHGLEDECDCGTWQNNQYINCTRAYNSCDWQNVNVWSCGASNPNSSTYTSPVGGGNDNTTGTDNENTTEGNVTFETVALEEEGTETSETCIKIAEQIADQDYMAAKEFLDGKIGEPIEYGKSVTTDGLYEDIEQNELDGTTLDVEISSNMVGFIHTHLNDVIENLGNGTIRTTKNYRMFSPDDVNTFLRLLRNANANGIDPGAVFVTMLSSTGNYTLRFSGDIQELLNNYTPELENYLDGDDAVKDFIKDYEDNGKTKGFLKFIKDQLPLIEGLDLFKINNNGTIKRKFLDNKNKVKTNRCQ